MSFSIEERCAFVHPHLIGGTGKHRVVQIVKEIPTSGSFSSTAPLTLGQEDILDDSGNLKHVSLYKLYMEIGDPTEYEFAKKVFNTWEHWKKIASHQAVSSHVAVWREELEIKVRCEAVKHLRAQSSKSTSAAMFLARKGYDEPPNTKKSKSHEEKVQEAIKSRIDADYARVMGGRTF